MLSERRMKKYDVAFLILQPIFATSLSLIFQVNFLTGIFLFMGIPCLYFSWRTKDMWMKTLIFSIAMGVIFSLFMDMVQQYNYIWFERTTIFPHFFGKIVVEHFLWGFLFTYMVLIFYEHFLDKGIHELFDKKLKYFFIPVILLSLVFVMLEVLNPKILTVNYAYLILGIVVVAVPIFSTLLFFPKLISKYAVTASYFFFHTMIYEWTAMELNHWVWPEGQFVGWVELLGHSFPFEQMMFFMFMGAAAILTYYEFFDDDIR